MFQMFSAASPLLSSFESTFVACFHRLGLVSLPILSFKLVFCIGLHRFIGLFTISPQLFH